jgi:hypothetical protein
VPGVHCLLAGFWESRVGSVKVQKQSERSVLQVTVGSNRMMPLVALAARFLAFRLGVRVRLSCGPVSDRGLSLGAIPVTRVSASFAHVCGFLQPLILSLEHSIQIHSRLGVCWLSREGFSLDAVRIRSATMAVACFLRRHLEAMPVSGRGFALMWYHAGRHALICGANFSAARFVLYFFAVFIILNVSLFRICWR